MQRKWRAKTKTRVRREREKDRDERDDREKDTLLIFYKIAMQTLFI